MSSIQANASVIAQIEAVFEDIANSLLRQDEISIPLRYKPRRSAADSQPKDGTTPKLTYISFPGKTPEEARRFTILARILELVHEALISDTIVSKRFRETFVFGYGTRILDAYIFVETFTTKTLNCSSRKPLSINISTYWHTLLDCSELPLTSSVT